MDQRDGLNGTEGASVSSFWKINRPASSTSFSSRDDSAMTSDDCMSNGEEDSTTDSHSVHSRRDSLESTKAPSVEIGAIAESSALKGSESGGGSGGGLGGETVRHNKRNLPKDEPGPGTTLRKACDLCTKRKRKCNGQHPCSQCIETGVQNQCVYSPRLKSGRKKKVRIDGVLYDEAGGVVDGGGLALVANGPRSGPGLGAGFTVDSSVGRFSASAAVGLAGHVENFFLATYLRDFNRIVPLTTESSVTEGMLEVLSPAVSARGLSQASPIPQRESRRQAKLAVFWGVVAMGSRILKAEDDATARYLGLMRTALKECFDSTDKEVVQAYLLLSTVETMRGNEEAGKRYLDHAHTMHNGNAVGPEGRLLQGRQEQEESLDLVFQIYGQPDGCVGVCSDGVFGVGEREGGSGGNKPVGVSEYAVDQMIAQAMSPPSEAQSGPLKALKYLSTACGLSSEVFDPTHKCVTVKQYLGEMDTALKGADSLFKDTDLSECITGVVMVKIWGGVTVLLRSWGKPEDKEMGLAQIEEGVGYALTRPGLMTFPMWWHALHCASIVFAHFGRNDSYMRLRETFNKNTFPGTEMPSIDTYSPGAICPQLGGSCSKLAYWMQVRGTMCSGPGWRPQFAEKLSEASESAAYAAALNGNSMDCSATLNKEFNNGVMGGTAIIGGGALQREPSNEQALRAALNAGLSELGELGGLEGLSAEADLDPLGVDLDLSQFKDLEEVEVALSHIDGVVGEVSAIKGDIFQVPVSQGSSGAVATEGEVVGGGEMAREVSFGIGEREGGDGGAVSGRSSLPMVGGGKLPRQSSLDINTIMQMVSSDEQLKQEKGGESDIMDAAMAFGEGPAKELFGVELSAP